MLSKMLDLDFVDQIFDISPVVSSETAVFPGDTVFSREVLMSQEKGSHLDLSSIRTTVHIGAHTDAPNHYGPNELSIDKVSLKNYMGACQVVEVKTAFGQRISLFDFEINDISCPRVLFKTNSFQPEIWNDEFVSLSPEVIQALASKGVILVGIDTPSIDPSTSKELESHKCILENNMSILEGVVLGEVPEGIYQIISLPLKLKDCDASPVRAILFKAN